MSVLEMMTAVDRDRASVCVRVCIEYRVVLERQSSVRVRQRWFVLETRNRIQRIQLPPTRHDALNTSTVVSKTTTREIPVVPPRTRPFPVETPPPHSIHEHLDRPAARSTVATCSGARGRTTIGLHKSTLFSISL